MKTRLSLFSSGPVLADGSKAHYRIGQGLLKSALSLCFLILLCPLARAQWIGGSYSVGRTKDQVGYLLDLLKAGNMLEAREYFYGKDVIHDRELADLIVFIDKTKGQEGLSESGIPLGYPVKFSLSKRGQERKDLFGEKFVYIIVFVAEKGNDPQSVEELIPTNKRTIGTVISDSSRTVSTEIEECKISPLSITQSSLDYKLGTGEFFLVSAVKAVAGAAIGSQTKAEEIKEIYREPLKITRVGCTKDKGCKDEDNIVLYFGYMRVALVENTVNRFTINETLVLDKKCSDKGRDKGPDKEINYSATFGNYCSSIFGSSVGFVGTFISAKQRTELSDKRFPIDAFLFGHVYIKRPRLPTPHYLRSTEPGRIAKRLSLSLACGTALKGNLLSDFFIGIGVGHLIGSFGFVAGYNSQTQVFPEGDNSGKRRRRNFCIGVSFTL